MEIQENKSTLIVETRDEQKIKKIWKTAFILLAITVVEFIMAFTMDRGIILYFLFIALTVWKAKYIMMEFMHLGDEVKPLFYSIIVPLIFLVWLVIALVKEGSDIFLMRW
ncbi:MAG: cytochrome C oxidase subunit IV family protein [Algoriphagus sp.]|jgi:cytochrome c oxidase subunit IV|uniref:cytochrome C oxidase subunit IV family protein n=1 Tax=Algoriphagus sp. TaxID=1872435 RepID=UPI0027239141|nr:cytochrome C oxidase subunit IV family protein [Algoriphagus sp.]MDO8968353.1 cytochrome C oxidase subunit IV family protein [Algoriphagus sp.]MDP2043306.1 cytochrome C oxidase subunit IV family protein [Algoriphagus sp.]MDP3200148.1 cytochrome C oxidase subunit IV family protein [Algoriphagus sp.]MDP3470821.1 cytochrome C oxidase subunit IV family protein [Algoriphagus sp.]